MIHQLSIYHMPGKMCVCAQVCEFVKICVCIARIIFHILHVGAPRLKIISWLESDKIWIIT